HMLWLGSVRSGGVLAPAAPTPAPAAAVVSGSPEGDSPASAPTNADGSSSPSAPESAPGAGSGNGTNGNGSGNGNGDDGPPLPPFNLTALALRTSRLANGVSALHGEVARTLWKDLDYGEGMSRVEIGHITNGVHAPTWIWPVFATLLAAHLGAAFPHNLEHPGFAETLQRIAPLDLWNAHLAQKKRLIHVARRKLLEQFARLGRSPEALRDVDTILDEDALTIGFARRFATYKRAALIFRDTARLAQLVRAEGRPIQIIFAGKAHPADRPGQQLIREIIATSQTPDFLGRVVFLEDYDMGIARYLVQGVDLWLNTPRRPQEASGTSGMKAALNGVLNCSILDGWWDEGFDSSHGWAFGREIP